MRAHSSRRPRAADSSVPPERLAAAAAGGVALGVVHAGTSGIAMHELAHFGLSHAFYGGADEYSVEPFEGGHVSYSGEETGFADAVGSTATEISMSAAGTLVENLIGTSCVMLGIHRWNDGKKATGAALATFGGTALLAAAAYPWSALAESYTADHASNDWQNVASRTSDASALSYTEAAVMCAALATGIPVLLILGYFWWTKSNRAPGAALPKGLRAEAWLCSTVEHPDRQAVLTKLLNAYPGLAAYQRAEADFRSVANLDDARLLAARGQRGIDRYRQTYRHASRKFEAERRRLICFLKDRVPRDQLRAAGKELAEKWAKDIVPRLPEKILGALTPVAYGVAIAAPVLNAAASLSDGAELAAEIATSAVPVLPAIATAHRAVQTYRDYKSEVAPRAAWKVSAARTAVTATVTVVITLAVAGTVAGGWVVVVPAAIGAFIVNAGLGRYRDKMVRKAIKEHVGEQRRRTVQQGREAGETTAVGRFIRARAQRADAWVVRPPSPPSRSLPAPAPPDWQEPPYAMS